MPSVCVFTLLIGIVFIHNAKVDINPHLVGMVTNPLLGTTHALTVLSSNAKFLKGLK